MRLLLSHITRTIIKITTIINDINDNYKILLKWKVKKKNLKRKFYYLFILYRTFVQTFEERIQVVKKNSKVYMNFKRLTYFSCVSFLQHVHSPEYLISRVKIKKISF